MVGAIWVDVPFTHKSGAYVLDDEYLGRLWSNFVLDRPFLIL